MVPFLSSLCIFFGVQTVSSEKFCKFVGVYLKLYVMSLPFCVITAFILPVHIQTRDPSLSYALSLLIPSHFPVRSATGVDSAKAEVGNTRLRTETSKIIIIIEDEIDFFVES